MKNFKIEVSKGLEKYNLIKKAESENILRSELHKEGFAVLSITEISDIEVSGNKLFFEINEVNGNTKIGTIVSNDIFKAYLKIKYELNYNLKYIYQNQNTPQEEKERIINELEAHYKIYLETNKKQIEKKLQEDKIKVKEVVEETTDTFQMKKELEQVYKIIDKVLYKLKNILDSNDILDFEKKELLKNIYSEIIKLKTSTNIPKLRIIGEQALTKIGEIELQILEDKKDDEYKKLLSETNKLLREVGSKKTFIEKDKDIGYLFNKFLKEFVLFLKDLKPVKKKKEVIDTTSTAYLKNKFLLNKYENKLASLNTQKIKDFIIYIVPSKENKEKIQDYAIRQKVIKQNITILKGRISGGIFSYVKIVKGYNYFIDKLIGLLNFLKLPINIIILVYSILFLINNFLLNFGIDASINLHGMFYFIYMYLFYILIQFTKGLLSLSFNVVIFSFLFIFGVINF